MTNAETNITDPFKDINLGNFKKVALSNYKRKELLTDKEIIKAIAQESNFKSREEFKDISKPFLFFKKNVLL